MARARHGLQSLMCIISFTPDESLIRKALLLRPLYERGAGGTERALPRIPWRSRAGGRAPAPPRPSLAGPCRAFVPSSALSYRPAAPLLSARLRLPRDPQLVVHLPAFRAGPGSCARPPCIPILARSDGTEKPCRGRASGPDGRGFCGRSPALMTPRPRPCSCPRPWLCNLKCPPTGAQPCKRFGQRDVR